MRRKQAEDAIKEFKGLLDDSEHIKEIPSDKIH
jgi:hypothetical protein